MIGLSDCSGDERVTKPLPDRQANKCKHCGEKLVPMSRLRVLSNVLIQTFYAEATDFCIGWSCLRVSL